jgi:hypothetical protein
MKAWSLIHGCGRVAETIYVPPTTWAHLWHFFDAVDLWVEGPGHLYIVLGYVVQANWTKYNIIKESSQTWALNNQSRLYYAKELHPDDFQAFFTFEDEQYFNATILTAYERDCLAMWLNYWRDVFTSRGQHSKSVGEIEDQLLAVERSGAFQVFTRKQGKLLALSLSCH